MITPFEEANPALLSCPARSTAVLSKATPHLATPSPSPPHPLPSTSTAQHPQLATAAAPPVIHREPELSSFVHEKGVATSNRIQGVRSTLPSPDATPDSGAHGQGAGTSAGERGTCCQNNYATEGGVASQSQSSQSQLESQEGSEGCAGMKGGMEMDCDEVEESQNYTPAAAEAGRSNASSSSKDRFVNGLVGASVLAIDSIWGPPTHTHSTPISHEASVLPLHWFVKEVLRRSRTSCSTLQVALYYLHQSRRDIRALVARILVEREELNEVERRIARFVEGDEEDYPTPPSSPTVLSSPHSPTSTPLPPPSTQESLTTRQAALLKSLSNPLLCGRRIFLASLISASKFLQDRNYSNRAWAKISGLTLGEINRNERAFLGLVGYGLFVGAKEFGCWTNRLASISLPVDAPEQVPATQYPHPPQSKSAAPPLATPSTVDVSTRQGMTRSISTPALKTLQASTPIPLTTLPTPALSPPSLLRSHSSSSSSSSSNSRPELARKRSVKPLPKRLARSTSVSTGAANGAGISWGTMEIDGPSGAVRFNDSHAESQKIVEGVVVV